MVELLIEDYIDDYISKPFGTALLARRHRSSVLLVGKRDYLQHARIHPHSIPAICRRNVSEVLVNVSL